MAQATNTTPGEIVLSGDLAGGADGTFPELRASGVTPGTYGPTARLSIDSKGRIVSIGQITKEEFAEYIITASKTVRGVVATSGSGIPANNVKFQNESSIISLPTSDDNTYGVVSIGDGFYTDGTNVQINYSAKIATKDAVGFVKIGSGFLTTAGVLNVPDFTKNASKTEKGLVQIGANLNVVNGVASFTLPSATANSKGGVQIGDGMSVTSGIMKLLMPPTATESSKGIAQPGTGIDINSGVLSFAPLVATTTTKGVVQIALQTGNNTLIVNSGVVSIANTSKTTLGLTRPNTILNHFAVDTGGALQVNVPSASTTAQGLLQAGDGLDVTNGAISISTATTSVRGMVQIGANLNVDAQGRTSIPVASTSNFGIVRAGTGIGFQPTLIELNASDASETVFGEVTVGQGFDVDNGLISKAASAIIPVATSTVLGKSKGTGIYLSMAEDATVSFPGFPNASATTLGRIVGVAPFYTGLSITDGYGVDGQNPDAGLIKMTGGIQPGTGFSIPAGTGKMSAAPATTYLGAFGVINVGAGPFQIDAQGVLSFPSNALPIATTSTKGGVKLGSATTSGFQVSGNVLLARSATTTSRGFLLPGNGLSIAGGVISLSVATTAKPGLMQAGTGVNIDANAVISVTETPDYTNAVLLASNNVYTKMYGSAVQNIRRTVSSDTEYQISDSNVTYIEFDDNALSSKISVDLKIPEASTFFVVVKQNALGNCLATISINSTVILGGSGILSTTPNSIDVIEVTNTSSRRAGQLIKGF